MEKSFSVEHIAILVDNQVNTKRLVEDIIAGNLKGFETDLLEHIGIFSQHQIEIFIEEEERHDLKILTGASNQSLKSMSSGERKKALLKHLLNSNLDCLILVNPYDNLDAQTHTDLKAQFENLASSTQLLQIVTRVSDILSFTQTFYSYSQKTLFKYADLADFQKQHQNSKIALDGAIPPPLNTIPLNLDKLIEVKSVSVAFDGRNVLDKINWTVKKGEFWQLTGPNGSGKSTLLNMITGDSPKSYGQDLTIFGHKKGTGESVWDIKELVGYFTPSMIDRFRGYHTLENMLISGLHDSIGLYQKPSHIEKRLAQNWLKLIRLESKKDKYFHQLSIGEKRLLMTARAMVKHSPLLILDEPTAGLDDASAVFFVNLVNTYAAQSESAIIYVSHRAEPNLKPEKMYKLLPSEKGSQGIIK